MWEGRGGPVGRALSYGPENQGSKLTWQNTAIAPLWHLLHVKLVEGAMYSKIPSKLYFWGTKARRPPVLACLRIVLRNEALTVG